MMSGMCGIKMFVAVSDGTGFIANPAILAGL